MSLLLSTPSSTTPSSPAGGVSVATAGMGGVGKTVLALEVVQHADVIAAFGVRVFWLTFGESPALLALQSDLLADIASKVMPSSVDMCPVMVQ